MRFITLSSLALAAAITAGGCVDHDYDLSEDIDLNISIGGDLALPESSTERLTLEDLFDLSSNSSLRPAEEGEYGLHAGDYVLVQSGSQSDSRIRIPDQDINRIKGDVSETDLDPFYDKGEPMSWVDASPSFNIVDLRDDDVTPELVSVSAADLDVNIEFEISYTSRDFSGTVYIEEGYTINFDDGWKLEITDPATASFLRMTSDNSMVFTRRVSADASTALLTQLHLISVDFSRLPEGQGLYAPAHFRLDGEVRSHGRVAINASDISASGVANVTLVTTTRVNDARIVGIKGVVDPKVTVNASTYSITDVPEFLSDETNRLDLTNPRFIVKVTNDSPVPVEINATLTSRFTNREPESVGFGSKHGTAKPVAAANATTEIVISRRPIPAQSGMVNVVVPDLGKLLVAVPEDVVVDDIDVKALNEEIYFHLNTEYGFVSNYDVVAPLEFGRDMQLNYKGDSDKWDTDLSDYGFHAADGKVTYTNSIPMDMAVSAVALDYEGNEINDVEVTVTGIIRAGDVDKASHGELQIHMACQSANLSRLNGIRYKFAGTYGDEMTECVFNKAQALTFDNITLRLIDGIILDLN